jgi:hypothetical protein
MSENIIDVLREAKLQLEYLNQKFPETGTTNSILSKIDAVLDKGVGELSDGYHTFNELYEFRKMYNAALFNEWAARGMYQVHKSKKHHDGEDCFGGGWFIVVAILPTGQISNHYELADWDLFKCKEVEKALFEFDGHTPKDVLERLAKLEYESSKDGFIVNRGSGIFALVQSGGREIVETYIVDVNPPVGFGSAYFDTETYKIHLLANGNYYKENSKGGLSMMNKDVAEKLIKR